jgi:hypothetical protein
MLETRKSTIEYSYNKLIYVNLSGKADSLTSNTINQIHDNKQNNKIKIKWVSAYQQAD